MRDPGRSRRFERRTSRYVPEASFASCHLRLVTVVSFYKSHRSARFVGAVFVFEILLKCFSLTCVGVVVDCVGAGVDVDVDVALVSSTFCRLRVH
jgi:hypothetical protein